MLPKQNRLKKNKHFNYIYKHGKSAHLENLSLIFIKTKIRPFKVGFTVSKKVGKSVVRSKIKRRLREALKKEMQNINPNYNYIFIAREGISNLDFEKICMAVKKLIEKAGLYENG